MSAGVRWMCIFALLMTGVWQLGAGLYIHAKAWLAQQLIASAWASTLAGQQEARPWPWADTWPVARLRVPDAGIDLYVLADASGRSLAFGPGYLAGSALPGTGGNTVIAAHRDTHFRFLQHLGRGTRLLLQTPDGREHRYRVVETHILDSRYERLHVDSDRSTLTLMTCYPFDALVPGGPLRYAAIAEPAPGKPDHGPRNPMSRRAHQLRASDYASPPKHLRLMNTTDDLIAESTAHPAMHITL